jgi:hypothetical protein
MRFIVLALLLVGCGTTREESSHEVRQDQSTTRTTTTATKTVPGPDGPVVAEVVETVSVAEQVGKSEANGTGTAATTVQLPPILDHATKVVSTVASAGTPWGMIATGAGAVVTAIATAFATSKSAKADAERKRADEHKRDADEGWAHAIGTKKPVTEEKPT